jgi:hypothetical protein
MNELPSEPIPAYLRDAFYGAVQLYPNWTPRRSRTVSERGRPTLHHPPSLRFGNQLQRAAYVNCNAIGRHRAQQAGLVRGWPARWHVIWCKVDELAARALKYVVVFRRVSVHRGATQGHRLPAIRARRILLHNIGYLCRGI